MSIRPQQTTPSPGISRWLFPALSLFFVGTTFLWLRLDRSPPSWDDSYYLTRSLVLYDALVARGLPGFAERFLSVMGFKPPLIAALPAPVYLLVGRHTHAALAVNLAALLVLFRVLYVLGKRYASSRAGLLAAFISGTMPMIYGLARWYLVECGLIALVAVVLCQLADRKHAGGVRWSFCLGVTCALGILMKFSFPLYVLFPALAVAIQNRRTLLRPRAWLSFAIPAAALALPWYLLNFRQAWQRTTLAGAAVTAQVYQTGQILSPTEIGRYLVKVCNTAPAVYLLVLGVLLPLCVRRLKPEAKQGLLLCAWWGAPILVLTFSHYRDVRYAAPLFPALALAIGILLDSVIARGRTAAVAVSILLALPTLNMLQTSFGVVGSRPLELGGLLFVPAKFNYARRFDRVAWPHREMLSQLYRSSKLSGGERKWLVIGTDSDSFNADTFALAALELNLPFEVDSTANQTDRTLLRNITDSAAYFIYEEGGKRESPLNPLGTEALQAIRESGRFVEQTAPRKLPDGGIAHVFESEPRAGLRGNALLVPEMDRVTECSVALADKLALTGLSIERRAGNLEVTYRWKCLRPVDRDYWCFTHVVDSHDHVAGYLDHALLNAQPAVSMWKAGDIAIEKLRFRLPEGAERETYHLRLGLFNRESGERLQITSSNFPIADGQTSILVNEPPR
jgi:hypothetical protein